MIDDDPEDVAPAEPEAVEDVAPASSPSQEPELSPSSREQRRVEQMEAEARQWREEADRYRREADYYRSSQQPAQPQYDASQDPNLDPIDRMQASIGNLHRNSQFQALATSAQFNAQLDRFKFEQELEKNPSWRRFEQEVEREYQQVAGALLQTGQINLIPPRMRLLRERIGEDVMKRGQRAVSAAQKEADSRTRRQATRPANVGSNVARHAESGETPAEAARRRLREAFPEAGY